MRKIILVGLLIGALVGCSDTSIPPTVNTTLPTAVAQPTPTRSDFGQDIDPVSYTHLDVYKRQL